ncbi:MAG: DNA replication/repair protein RecF [Nitriliruptoraceae bacterium]
MLIRRLELTDMRSYERLTLDLDRGVSVLVGPNGQGKTNLIEAVYRVASGTSHRVAGDGPLVKSGAERAVIRTIIETDGVRRRTVEIEFGSGVRTRIRVDGQDVRRSVDAHGILRTVLFAPEDLALVRGDPADRRRFLDEVLGQRRPAYAVARAEFDRVLRQRNQMLKQMRTLSNSAQTTARDTLATWTGQLVHHAAQLTAARIAAIRTLAGPVEDHYQQLADCDESVGVEYVMSADGYAALDSGPLVPDPAPIAATLRSALNALANKEIERGLTLVGPHRDDVNLTIDGLPARTHASQGEAWSLALALKLGTYDLLAEVGDRPILLLDDVFAELDERRRARLSQVCHDYDQVLVTAAVDADVPLEGRRYDVVRTDRHTVVTAREGDGGE